MPDGSPASTTSSPGAFAGTRSPRSASSSSSATTRARAPPQRDRRAPARADPDFSRSSDSSTTRSSSPWRSHVSLAARVGSLIEELWPGFRARRERRDSNCDLRADRRVGGDYGRRRAATNNVISAVPPSSAFHDHAEAGEDGGCLFLRPQPRLIGETPTFYQRGSLPVSRSLPAK
jgi:hypothetical protein